MLRGGPGKKWSTVDDQLPQTAAAGGNKELQCAMRGTRAGVPPRRKHRRKLESAAGVGWDCMYAAHPPSPG